MHPIFKLINVVNAVEIERYRLSVCVALFVLICMRAWNRTLFNGLHENGLQRNIEEHGRHYSVEN